MILVSPSIKICDFFFIAGVLEPCRRSEKRKRKKETLLGHWSLVSLTGSGVRHTLPKMACRCNLVVNPYPHQALFEILSKYLSLASSSSVPTFPTPISSARRFPSLSLSRFLNFFFISMNLYLFVLFQWQWQTDYKHDVLGSWGFGGMWVLAS